MIIEHAQRWREQEARWVSHRQTCDTRVIEVVPISEQEAKDFITTHHYSGSYPSVRCRLGVFERGQLVGALTYGVPAGPKVLACWTGYGQEEAVELSRLVLLDEVGFNAESYVIAQARRVLREELPEVRAILSFSDPVPRYALDGDCLLPGHVGTIYQATNFAYMGRGTPRTHYLDARGHTISPKVFQKVRQGLRGHAYAQAVLEEASGVMRRSGESGGAFIKRARKELRKLRHPVNHAYVCGVDRRTKYTSRAPRPKQIDPVQLGIGGAA